MMNKKQVLLNIVTFAGTALVAIAIGLQLPALFKKTPDPIKKGDFSVHVSDQKHPLTLYGTTTCKYCTAARDYLKQAGVPFNDRLIDRSADASAQYDKLKETGVPVLVSKDRLIVGFDKEFYYKILQQISDK